MMTHKIGRLTILKNPIRYAWSCDDPRASWAFQWVIIASNVAQPGKRASIPIPLR